MGCIGKDKFGDILKTKAEAVGVSVHYQYHEKEATGTAACIITGNNRYIILYLNSIIIHFIDVFKYIYKYDIN